MLKKIGIGIVLAVLVIGIAGYLYIDRALLRDPFTPLFADSCASCHGDDMAGTGSGPSLLEGDFPSARGVRDLERQISGHPPVQGLPERVASLTDEEVRGLSILIGETATNRTYRTFEIEEPLGIPEGVVESELHNFRLEVVTDALHALPFSLAPLPDGGVLVTEKMKGLRYVSASGEVSELIEGTPEVFDDGFDVLGLPFGVGWLLDVALHPDFASNGWIYLHYTERCTDCDSIEDRSRNTVVRGRIESGRWVDQELIWQPGREFYSNVPDIGAGGRLAFDDAGHLFISVGIKGRMNYDGMQNLSTPIGKIHRVNLDGSIPLDNPFVTTPGAMQSVWTYGHRSPQGLEFNHRTGELWETEMGPRGGDEVNVLVPGRNYGWPLTSRGIDYDGTHVEYGRELNLEFDPADIEQPRIDLTPGPAVSSFAFCEGGQFAAWQGHLIVGTLAARELYRIDPSEGGRVETLLRDVGRIRDVELGADGAVYLLIEHPTGGRILRMIEVRAENTDEHDSKILASRSHGAG